MKIKNLFYEKYHARLKRNLRKKKTFKGMLLIRLLIAFVIFFVIAVNIFCKGYFSEDGFLWNALAPAYNMYSEKLERITYDYELYQDGGINRVELVDMTCDEQFAASIGRTALAPSLVAKNMNGYWGIYDYDKKEMVVGQLEEDGVVVTILYKLDGNIVTINYMVADEQREAFLAICEDGSINITSGYIKGNKIYVESYEKASGEEITADLSGLDLDGCRHISCDVKPNDMHKWSTYSTARYGVDGKYEIAVLSGLELLGSFDPEVKKMAIEKLEERENVICFEDEDFVSRRYWFITPPSEDGKALGTVFTYSVNVDTEMLKMVVTELIVAVILLTLAVAALWTAVEYTRYKVQYDTYAYRTMIVDMLAHDLKTPLTVISGCAENITESEDLEKNKVFSEKITENVSYMNKMISNILTMSEKENLTIEDRVSMDIEAAIKNLVKENQTLFDNKNLTVSISGAATAEVDETSFVILLRNVLDNALKYAPEGDTIEIKLNDKEISFSNTLAYEMMVSEEKLFDAFVKGNKARTGRNGNGIGLAIVKSIADAHGYRYEISTEGNVFLLRISM